MANAPTPTTPLPADFLAWQVDLRRTTMTEGRGAPRAGVAPLLTVRRPGRHLGVSTSSIICGLLPAPELLAAKTEEFRALYEEFAPAGAKAVYDRGITYLVDYYTDPAKFDPTSVTTLLRGDSDSVVALAAEPSCQLLFYVFDLVDRTPLGRFRCISVDCEAELLRAGAVFDNVWWHNTLFHGPLEGAVVVRFHHRGSWDTGFGRFDRLD